MSTAAEGLFHLSDTLAHHARELRDSLALIVGTLNRQLELAEVGARRARMSGTVVGGSTVGNLEPVALVGPNENRRGLSVQNIDAVGYLTLGLGLTTPTAGVGMVLAPGATWDGRISGELWMGRVHAISNVAACAYCWLEAR